MTTPLTPSGEVARFIDDDQFASGQSTEKCGPEAVALFWHSTAPQANNPYSSSQVHQMAAEDYQKFIGLDNPQDQGGTSNQTLYDMLAFHHFAYKVGPVGDWGWIKGWLALGYPVIIGIAEASVYDLQLKANPYAWNPAGLYHIILCTGAGSTGEILVRDTASIAPTGVRPGPRHYDTSKLQLTSATMVVPSWLHIPAGNNPPVVVPPPPPPPPPVDYKKMAQDAMTQLQNALAHLN